MPSLIFLTHPEVVVDPLTPVPRWPLSPVGRARMDLFADTLARHPISAIHASTEQKAVDGASILSRRYDLPVQTDEALGENDRSSTGYIAPPEFWEVVRKFFAHPRDSVRGWERAIDAQARIVAAMRRIARDAAAGDVVVVSHGGVGCLLTAHLQNVGIGSETRPSHPGGGCFIVIDRETFSLEQDWRTIEDGFA